MNSIQQLLPIKPRKQVIGKHGLGDGDRAEARVSRETHSGIKYVNPLYLPQMTCGNVLMLGLGAQTEPGRRSHQWRLSELFIQRHAGIRHLRKHKYEDATEERLFLSFAVGSDTCAAGGRHPQFKRHHGENGQSAHRARA